MNSEIERRKQNWIDFADCTSPKNRLLVINCAEKMPVRPMLWWENANERMEWSYGCYCQQMENLDKINDNTIPFLSMITGTEIFAEAFGCKVHKSSDNNPFALPFVNNVSELSKIKVPRLEDTKLTLLFEMADKLKERAGKDALLSLPDIQTPMDIAALIWEKSDFFASMYEEPAAIKELSCKIKEFQFSFLDKWFERYGKETIAHYPDYYMPYGVTMSEDEIGTVSSDMFNEFFRDEIHEFANRYGAIGIHCCADSRHQWANLREIPHLRILNLVRNEKQTLESLDFFRNTCGQYPDNALINVNDIENTGNIHYACHAYVDSKKRAASVADYFNANNYINWQAIQPN